jgi:hypothetical protein
LRTILFIAVLFSLLVKNLLGFANVLIAEPFQTQLEYSNATIIEETHTDFTDLEIPIDLKEKEETEKTEENNDKKAQFFIKNLSIYFLKEYQFSFTKILNKIPLTNQISGFHIIRTFFVSPQLLLHSFLI